MYHFPAIGFSFRRFHMLSTLSEKDSEQITRNSRKFNFCRGKIAPYFPQFLNFSRPNIPPIFPDYTIFPDRNYRIFSFPKTWDIEQIQEIQKTNFYRPILAPFFPSIIETKSRVKTRILIPYLGYRANTRNSKIQFL